MAHNPGDEPKVDPEEEKEPTTASQPEPPD